MVVVNRLRFVPLIFDWTQPLPPSFMASVSCLAALVVDCL